MDGGVGSPEGGGPTTRDMGDSVVRSPEGVSPAQAPHESGRANALPGPEAPAGGASLLVQEAQAPQTPAPEATEPAAPEPQTAAPLRTIEPTGVRSIIDGLNFSEIGAADLNEYDNRSLGLIMEGLRRQAQGNDDAGNFAKDVIAEIAKMRKSRAASAPG